MWIPKCCTTKQADNPDINAMMRNEVRLYYQKLLTNTQNNIQKNSYSGNLILSKRCYVKDRSFASQDTAISSGVQNPENSKELIFEFFDVTDYRFNEVEWADARFKVLGISKLATASLDGKRFIATDHRPFISILVGMKKL